MTNYNYHDAMRPHVNIMSLGDWSIDLSGVSKKDSGQWHYSYDLHKRVVFVVFGDSLSWESEFHERPLLRKIVIHRMDSLNTKTSRAVRMFSVKSFISSHLEK